MKTLAGLSNKLTHLQFSKVSHFPSDDNRQSSSAPNQSVIFPWNGGISKKQFFIPFQEASETNSRISAKIYSRLNISEKRSAEHSLPFLFFEYFGTEIEAIFGLNGTVARIIRVGSLSFELRYCSIRGINKVSVRCLEQRDSVSLSRSICSESFSSSRWNVLVFIIFEYHPWIAYPGTKNSSEIPNYWGMLIYLDLQFFKSSCISAFTEWTVEIE